MKRNNKGLVKMMAVTASSAAVLMGSAYAESLGEPGRDAKGSNPLNNVYFGEQHLHTVLFNCRR